MDYRYFGEYASFVPASKSDGELLQGADFIVGDALDIEFREEDAWVRNRFGGYAGKLDADVSRRLRVAAARGWTCKALLSLVAFTDAPAPGFYWGQVALVCFDPAFADAFEPWCAAVGEKMAEGARVQVGLSEGEVTRVIESAGTWLPAARADIPFPEAGKSVVLKKTRSLSERMIERGRERRPGCLAVGWAFNIALVGGLVALILHLCGVF